MFVPQRAGAVGIGLAAFEPLADEFEMAADIDAVRLAAGAGDRQRDDRHRLLEGNDIEHLGRIDENILIMGVLEADQRHPSLSSFGLVPRAGTRTRLGRIYAPEMVKGGLRGGGEFLVGA